VGSRQLQKAFRASSGGFFFVGGYAAVFTPLRGD